MAKTGKLSINSENMLPIIKKWLYSDHDIFVREQIANACDAITKLKKLEGVGEYKPEVSPEYRVDVIVNPDEHTLKFIDNGIGMTEEEVEKYITQIAFSGATEFLKKYEGKTDQDQIIGHFGLGFYSAFMVADEVHIDTLSYQEGAKPVHWESDGESEYAIGEGTKQGTGTEITLFLNDECYEFCNEYRIRSILEKYCSFMPTPIFLTDASEGAKKREAEEDERRATRNAKNKEDAVKRAREDAEKDAPEGCAEEEKKRLADEAAAKAEAEFKPEVKPVPQPINDIHPLWTKRASECTEEEYKGFYRKVFNDYKEPLFYIHLNTEYPFNLRGILYFPKINTEYDALESQIKLYNNQVFIADNIKEVIPEFLLLLKGVIDCPDLPLNVSRSALQNDGFVQKISDYISKKVADKLTGMCKTDRENYEKYWDDIAPFIKYGCLKDEKFAERMNDYILFKNIDGKYLTLKDCMEENKERFENKVFYVTDENEQSQYIRMFREQKIDAVILPHAIDAPFISRLEQKNKDLKFLRIDADLSDAFREETPDQDEAQKKQDEALAKAVKKAIGNDKLTVKLEALKDAATASILTVSEESRRMQEMMKQYSMGMDLSMFAGEGETLVLNTKHPLVEFLRSKVVVTEKTEEKKADEAAEEAAAPAETAEAADTAAPAETAEGAEEKAEEAAAPKKPSLTKQICEQLYDLARIQHGSLSPDRMADFIRRSNEIMCALTGERK